MLLTGFKSHSQEAAEQETEPSIQCTNLTAICKWLICLGEGQCWCFVLQGIQSLGEVVSSVPRSLWGQVREAEQA